MDEDVPASLQSEIETFKDAFASLADAELACATAKVEPEALEAEIAKLLDANRPVVQEVYDPNKPPQLDHIYGGQLKVKVSRPPRALQVLLVEFNFGIDCGFDSLLLGYEYHDGVWTRVLRWESPAYNRIDSSFGDFFNYVLLPGKAPQEWSIAVAHGHPWCTSNLSAFDIDLLKPVRDHAGQHVLAHKEFYYRRDTDPVMRAEPDGFELKMTGESIDPDIVMRPVIYRYRVTDGTLERVQPIANNGRDFVDEWLESPLNDSARWSSTTNLLKLERVHEGIRKLTDSRDPNAKEFPLLNFGPVRGCSDSRAHFQVELDEEWVDSKGGSRAGEPTYFQIDEGKNSFTMVSAGLNADARCTGSDIMAKN